MDKATFIVFMDKYIDGMLSEAEKIEFEKMIQNDYSLKNDFELHKAIRKGIKKSGRKDLLRELEIIKNQPINQNPLHKIINKYWRLLLLTFIGTILSLIIIFKKENTTEVEKSPTPNTSKEMPYVVDLREEDTLLRQNYYYQMRRLDSIKRMENTSIDSLNNRNKDTPIYAGVFEVSIMPGEGKLGSSPKTEMTIVFINDKSDTYEMVGDSIRIFAVLTDRVKNLLIQNRGIVINQKRELEIRFDNHKLLYTLKK